MENKTKQIITSILATSVIGGGAIVGLQKPDLLTYEESQVLISMYQEVVKQNQGVLTMSGNISTENLNNLLLQLNVDKATIDGVELDKIQYEKVRDILIEKSEQKFLAERVVKKLLK